MIISSPVLSMIIPAFILSLTPLSSKNRGLVSKVAIAVAEMLIMLMVTLLINVFVKVIVIFVYFEVKLLNFRYFWLWVV